MELLKAHLYKIIYFVIGFVVGSSVIFLYTNQKKEELLSKNIEKSKQEFAVDKEKEEYIQSELEAEKEKILTKEAKQDNEDSVYKILKVSDQKAGNSVSVAYVKADFPVWLVVHEEKDGKIWSALGARRKDKGEWTGVNVPLLRNTKSGARYWLVLYKDNGDGVFDLDNDFPLKSSKGFYIMLPFNVI